MISFSFDDISVGQDEQTLSFSYRIHGVRSVPILCTEEIQFPHKPTRPHFFKQPEVIQALRLLHGALGASYWKIFHPESLVFSTYTLPPDGEDFLRRAYTKGFGEFFMVNDLNPQPEFTFSFLKRDQAHIPNPHPESSVFAPSGRYFLGIGGGKDSIVSAELLREANIPFTGLILQTGIPYEVVDNVLAQMKVPAVRILRTLAPNLGVLHTHPQAKTGHVPISYIYAAIGVLASLWYGHDGFIVSNERSADEENAVFRGMKINHQWSKTTEFETMFAEYCKKYIAPHLRYVSLLRNLSEFQITALFAQYRQYFTVFSSCNRNFSSTQPLDTRLWCGACAKCVFVALLLHAHLPPQTVSEIFGSDILQNPAHQELVSELAGIDGHKPFDCVGTYEEVALALFTIERQQSYRLPAYLKHICDRLRSRYDYDTLVQLVSQPSSIDASLIASLRI